MNPPSEVIYLMQIGLRW